MYFFVERVVTERGPYQPRRAVKQPKTFSERLLVVRRALGLNQAALAEAVGVPQQSVSSWERDITEPSGPAMTLLTTVLGVSAEALQTGKGFSIPEVDATPPGALMVAERGAKKAITLPKAVEGEAWGVDAKTGEQVALTREEAMAWLADALNEQAPVWIVRKSGGSPKANRPGRRKKK